MRKIKWLIKENAWQEREDDSGKQCEKKKIKKQKGNTSRKKKLEVQRRVELSGEQTPVSPKQT